MVINMKNENFEAAKALRHELHAHPELSLNENWTRERLKAFLKNTALEVTDKGAWLYAYIKGTGKKAPIAFRADIDAVPVWDKSGAQYASLIDGVSHACGHDGHAATLCALALELSENPPERDVYLIFQHAEEIGAGAKECAQLIDEKGIVEVYAYHHRPGFPYNTAVIAQGACACASKGMTIYMKGTPCHASMPELGKNPAQAIARLICRLGQIDEKYEEMVLCTVICVEIGERAFGTSASEGRLMLTIRGQREDELNALQAEIERFAAMEAESDGLELSFSYCDEFPETRNHAASAQKVRQACERLGISVQTLQAPWRSSEDFGYFLKKAEGAMILIGDGEDYPELHTSRMDFPDELIKTATDLFMELI